MLRPPGALGSEDLGAILGIHGSGYAGHDYARWLLEQVAADPRPALQGAMHR
ncbi:MAG TPA: hypothetical protein VGO80_06185 [Solirubrobacteraceae bacterium]|jgi:hypothetical protein|nr:hypothetical protein [Solirubrobacteraceae bacterium]